MPRVYDDGCDNAAKLTRDNFHAAARSCRPRAKVQLALQVDKYTELNDGAYGVAAYEGWYIVYDEQLGWLSMPESFFNEKYELVDGE